jgi:carbon monoxide dehydrogenase subunit G
MHMADTTEGSTEIDASPAEVLAVITDFDAYPEWAGVQSAEVRARDGDGRPSEVAMKVSQMGVDAAYTLSYTYAPGDAGVSWTTTEASGAVKDVTGEYALEPVGAGTKVTYRLALELGIPLPGLLKRQAQKQVINTALGGLKKRVEGR